AYSLLYDIKHTKPALDIKAGAFYNGIPNFSIKAKEKLPDGKTLLDVIIYDHSQGRGNKTVILSDSSMMYTILDDRYLKLELYNGNYYNEQPKKRSQVDQLIRTEYYRMDMVFSLASFDLKRRKEELFQNNRQMKNIRELTHDIDSFGTIVNKAKINLINHSNRSFNYHIKDKEKIKNFIEVEKKTDTLGKHHPSYKDLQQTSIFPVILFEQLLPKKERTFGVQQIPNHGQIQDLGPEVFPLWDSSFFNLNEKRSMSSEDELLTFMEPTLVESMKEDTFLLDTIGWDFLDKKIAETKRLKKKSIITTALTQARNIKVNVQSTQTRVYKAQKDKNLYTIEKYKKYAQAMACILMFMIGAPLGAIIKKGGLGVPTIIAILFFIIFYVFTSVGEKSAKEGAMNPYFAVWLSDLVLLPFGLFFLRQARIDARLFEVDFYNIWIEKLKTRFARK
ncbi:MAG: LptF/LptG family permease, partial [Bacteroidota bacterium]